MFVLAREEKRARARACARVRVCAHVYISKYLGGFFHAREKMNIGMIIT